MIRFKQINSDKVITLSYEEMTRLFYESEISRENRSLIVNFMLFLESYASRNQIELQLIKESDWARLVQIATGVKENYSRMKAILPDV